MEAVGVIILIVICFIAFGLLGKILGVIWTIIEWLLGGIGNCIGCFLWVILFIVVLAVIAGA